MESCRILYRIKVAHDYFAEAPCPALQCCLTPQGEALARRRGLLFRRMATGEWALLSIGGQYTGGDELALDLSVADTDFPLYTEWDVFRPSEACVLELPQTVETVEAAIIRRTGRRRGRGEGFCTIVLRLTGEMAEAAKTGNPLQTTIHFRAPSVRWEYLFVPRDGDSLPSGGLRLEDTAGIVEFSDFKKCEVYGKQAWRTVSEAPIPMRWNYGCRLRLVAQEAERPKRILLTRVPPPSPGRFPDAGRSILRQLCYY